jgi:Ca-activated chloride channel homolog
MSFADAPIEGMIAWGIVIILTGAATLIAIRRRWTGAAGLRFPTGHRLDGVGLGWRARLAHLPLWCRCLAVALLVIAVARPQLTEKETAEVEGIDIVVAFDMSQSMAQVDIADEELVALQNAGKEPDDRFKSAIQVLRNFVSSRRYDRVSLVIFGKEAFLQFPLTLDYGVMLNILDRMSLGDIDGTGTAIGNALGMSIARLRESEAKTKIVILITDGEDNGSKVAPLEMAKEAAERGARIYPILVGGSGQTWRPSNMVDMFTGQRKYEKVDTKVNPALLEEIAEAANGRFYRSTDKEQLKKDFHHILDELEKSRLVDYAAAEKTEVFHWFLWPALALLFLEILLSQTVLRRFP